MVQKVGVSIYAPNELDAVLKVFSPDIVQAPFNLVDHRLIKTGWLQRLKDNGIEIHVRSIFLQGLLLMPRANIPPVFDKWSYLWDKWHDWLVGCRMSAIDACLAYPFSLPEIDRVVVGADSVKQLNEIINTISQSKGSFPDLECTEENLINPSCWSSL